MSKVKINCNFILLFYHITQTKTLKDYNILDCQGGEVTYFGSRTPAKVSTSAEAQILVTETKASLVALGLLSVEIPLLF